MNYIGKKQKDFDSFYDIFGLPLTECVLKVAECLIDHWFKENLDSAGGDAMVLIGFMARCLDGGRCKQLFPKIFKIIKYMLTAKNNPMTQAGALYITCSLLANETNATINYCVKIGFWSGFQKRWLSRCIPEPGVTVKTASLHAMIRFLSLSPAFLDEVFSLFIKLGTNVQSVLRVIYMTMEDLLILKIKERRSVTREDEEDLDTKQNLIGFESYDQRRDEKEFIWSDTDVRGKSSMEAKEMRDIQFIEQFSIISDSLIFDPTFDNIGDRVLESVLEST